MAQEDMMDLLEERNSKDSLSEKYVSEIMEEKSQLLNLAFGILDYFNTSIALLQETIEFMNTEDALKERGEKPHSQAAMLKDSSSKLMSKCGLSAVGNPGEVVDYNYHQVVEALEGEDDNQSATIAAIHKPGYKYRNKLFRKAQVIAYKRK